ncbi:hypothetical protein CL616_01670 [archaeon]|nr:hypothetical protein [archaeon]
MVTLYFGQILKVQDGILQVGDLVPVANPHPSRLGGLDDAIGARFFTKTGGDVSQARDARKVPHKPVYFWNINHIGEIAEQFPERDLKYYRI